MNKREKVALTVVVAAGTLVAYWYFFGRRHSDQRAELISKLNSARSNVRELEDKLCAIEEQIELNRLEEQASRSRAGSDGYEYKPRKQIRIYMDGAFDMMHYGHMNAFRQGRACGNYLIVGINSDESITQCKGVPVMNDEERTAAVAGCKFVDEVIPEAVPYVMSEEFLSYIIKKYDIDYVVHGDDPCIVDGKDVYATAKKLGKYKSIPRTEGISTTDIVGRMLLMSKSHHSVDPSDGCDSSTIMDIGEYNSKTLMQQKSNFLTTSRIMRLFSAGVRAPEPNSKIVYIAGSWDMFHAGHNAILQKAHQYGDYVIVGIHGDGVVNTYCKERDGNEDCNLPIMSLHERVLSVLGCKYVDDVVIDAPYVITRDMINSLNISVVIVNNEGRSITTLSRSHSSNNMSATEKSDKACGNVVIASGSNNNSGSAQDPYAIVKQMGIVQYVDYVQHEALSVTEIIMRISAQHERYTKK